MVVFALAKTRTSSENKQFSPIKQSDTSYDVLDDLMGLNKFNNANNCDSLDTSSFNLQDIMNKLATKEDVIYKDALINSLYAQIEYLRNDASRKNDIIQSLVNKNNDNILECTNINEGHVRNTNHSSNTSCEENSNVANIELLDVTVQGMYREKVNVDDQLKQVRELRRSAFYATKADKDYREWENHTSGYGSKIMFRMGYRGGGLGKDEDGIINPIAAESKSVFCSSSSSRLEEKEDVLPCVTPSRVVNYVHPWPATQF